MSKRPNPAEVMEAAANRLAEINGDDGRAAGVYYGEGVVVVRMEKPPVVIEQLPDNEVSIFDLMDMHQKEQRKKS